MNPHGRFIGWNRSGWLGAIGGMTAFMYLIALEILLEKGSGLFAGLSLAVAVSETGLGWYLWKNRTMLSAKAAAQILIWSGFGACMALFAFREIAGLQEYSLRSWWWVIILGFLFFSIEMHFVGGIPRFKGPEERIRSFLPEDPVVDSRNVTVEAGAWRLHADAKLTVSLFRIDPPEMDKCVIIYRACIRSQNLNKKAYMEMWVRFPGKGEFFSKGLTAPVEGDTDWSVYDLPFICKRGQKPDRIRLNFVFEGPGTVWMKDMELLKAPI